LSPLNKCIQQLNYQIIFYIFRRRMREQGVSVLQFTYIFSHY
jgi:hypothetical protein